MATGTLNDHFINILEEKVTNPNHGLRFEALRIASFVDWPENANTGPLELAKAGFYRSGRTRGSDQVTCFSCGINVSQWQTNDVPLHEHRKLSPECLFLSPDPSDPHVNIPLEVPHEDISLQEAYERLKNTSLSTNGNEAPKELNHSTENEDDEPDSSEPSQPSAPHQNGSAITLPYVQTGFASASSLQQPPGTSSPRVDVLGNQSSLNTISADGGSHHTSTSQAGAAFIADGNTLHNGNIVQAAIDRVPKTHKLSQPAPQPRSTDPRKRADFAFMDRMRSEKERRSTFYDWPQGAWQHPTALAAADRCQCAFCRGILRNWEPNDVPMEEHGKHFKECPFLLGRPVGNIPIPTNQSEGMSLNRTSDDLRLSSHLPQSNDLSLGIVTQRPKNPEFAIEAIRSTTFNHPAWPQHIQQSPAILAKAGFFYVGFADNVKCFYCDGGLRNWEPGDDPWKEHARWFPRCTFVRTTKGDAFIREIQSLQTPPERPTASISQGVTYRIEQKEIKARMDTAIVESVIAKGHSKETVRRVIEERLKTTGDDFPSVKSLFEAVLEAEEQINREKNLTESQNVEGACGIESTETTTVPNGDHVKVDTGSKSKRKRKNKKGKKTAATQGSKDQTNESKNSTGNAGDRYHLNAEYQALIAQNEAMKEQRVCKICMDNDVNLVFLPCAHLVSCANCAPALRNCPICRKLIKGTVRIYLS